MTEVTVTVLFHAEGALAAPALASMRDMVAAAREAGITIEARAMLDRPDALTRHMVAARGDWLDGVDEVAVGDTGLARNAAAGAALGRFIAFLDGDDLWGAEWIRRAHAAASAPGAPAKAIWHPQELFFFTDEDFDRHATGAVPHPAAVSHYMEHVPSDDGTFDRDVMFLDNVWSANAFAPRDVHLRHPYAQADRASGFGIEDWSWNMATLWAGVPHLVVPDTVHIIRLKETGSLSRRNTAEGLLPHLPSAAVPELGSSRRR